MYNDDIKNYLEKLDIQKSLMGYDPSSVKEALVALDSMYSEALSKELSRRDQVIQNQNEQIKKIEIKLNKATDLCLETKNENIAIHAENQKLKKALSEMSSERKLYEKERLKTFEALNRSDDAIGDTIRDKFEQEKRIVLQEVERAFNEKLQTLKARSNEQSNDAKLIREYLEELVKEKNMLLSRIEDLSKNIHKTDQPSISVAKENLKHNKYAIWDDDL